MTHNRLELPWLYADEAFPPLEKSWPLDSHAPGLLAAGADLSVKRLRLAYSQCIFPWFSEGQPILWWSPDPRMVLGVSDFKLYPSLRKTIKKFARSPRCELRIDTAFEEVIRACSSSKRRAQSGTWIVPEMVEAYCNLHAQGSAHSVETWIDGQLSGGLYCVALGQAVFGESMFSRVSDASKIALAGLVAFCRANGISQIDCQQNTAHLSSLGAHEVAREDFVAHVRRASSQHEPRWSFDPLYWQLILANGHKHGD